MAALPAAVPPVPGPGRPSRFPAVLFDFDGTLTHPDSLDFPALRAAIGCPPATLILEYIDALPTAEERAEKRKVLADFELAAARRSVPNDGAEETIALLHDAGVRIGILTRNTRSSIMASLANFTTIGEKDFAVIVTRESEGRPKPHPDGVLAAARIMGVEPGTMLVVGDFVFDIAAGKAAGSPTVLITNGRQPQQLAALGDIHADYTIAQLGELAGILGI